MSSGSATLSPPTVPLGSLPLSNFFFSPSDFFLFFSPMQSLVPGCHSPSYRSRTGTISDAPWQKSVNKPNWKNQSRWFSYVNLFFVVSPYLSFSFMETGFSKSQGIIKALPSLDSSSLIQLMQFKGK